MSCFVSLTISADADAEPGENVIEDFQAAPINPSGLPTTEIDTAYAVKKQTQNDPTTAVISAAVDYDNAESNLTEEDLLTLRRVPASMP